MKKLLIGLSFLLLPGIVLAAYNDVSLDSSVILTLGSYTLNVSGSSSVIQSIVIDGSSSFTAVLLTNSSLSVTSPTFNKLAVNDTSAPSTNICGDSVSQLTLASPTASPETIIVTVTADLCNGTSGGGGGGGGGGGSPATPAVSATPATPAVPKVSPAVPAIPATPAIPASASFKALAFSGVGVGSRTSEVISLQKILNSDTDTQVSSSGPGSPGNETNFFGPATKKAIQKFQVKYGIVAPGQTGYGVFGPKTKAKINEVAQMKGVGGGSSSSSMSSTPTTQSSSNASDIAKQISDALKAVQLLQNQLNSLNH